MTFWRVILIIGLSIAARAVTAPSPNSHETLRTAFQCSGVPRQWTRAVVSVVIDDSGTMKAFSRMGEGERFPLLLSSLAAALDVRRGDGMRRLSNLSEIRVWDEPRSPSFYTAGYSPLENFFDAIGKDRRKIHVLVSDLEHTSRRGSFAQVALPKLREAVDQCPNLALIGFRTSATEVDAGGDYWSANRPVYIIVAAPTSEDLHRFIREAGLLANPSRSESGDQSPTNVYYATRAGAEVTSLKLEARRNNAWRQAGTTFLECDTTRRRIPIFSFDAVVPNPAPLFVRVHARVHVPFDLAQADEETDLFVETRGTKANGRPPIVERRARSIPVGRDCDILLEYEVGRPIKNSALTYRIRFKPRPGALRLPQWVQEWSGRTRSRGTIHTTPHLRQIVRTMIERVTETTPILEHFVVIRPREKEHS